MLLNVHSCYSLKYGVMNEKELLELAATHGHRRMALTDINNTSACLNFLRMALRYGIHAAVGVDFRQGNQRRFVAVARDNEGFQEINAFLSQFQIHGLERPLPRRAPHWEHVWTIYPMHMAPTDLLPHEFVGVLPHELSRIAFSPWARQPEKLVAMPAASFRHKRDHNTHRLLRAIDQNTLLSKLSPLEQAPATDLFPDKQQMAQWYRAMPELITRAEALLDSCEMHFDYGKNNNKKLFGSSRNEDVERLRSLTYSGVGYRYPQPGDHIFDRISKELDIITQKDYTSYFLISDDIVRYARHKGYYHVGRGSGANSIVAYCLGITDVDPIELDLYFERFINLYRENPPDFDLDFSWTDRDDITQYIFKKHGTEHTALLAAYVTFQFKSVLRELGKVFGLPPAEIDALQSKAKRGERLDEIEALVLRYSRHIHELPNHLSVHAGGILISEKPIHHYTGTFVPPKGYATTHFDMVVAEDAGLYKYDILSQRGLGHIRDTVEEVARNRGVKIDIHDVKAFKQDESIKSLLREGRTMGCFYVESPAMRMLLSKLRTDDYKGLVAASSIIRPGVAQSGMMREYILRHRSPERRAQAHPVMQDIMPETYGVMVYQEDVIKVAHYFAGLSLAEADVLRRGMSGKYRSREEFAKAREKFFENCRQKGYSEEMTAEVWRQTESFAGYAFSKGHSASYAVESYQSLYLKAHFPLEFMVGVINNFGGFYRTEFYVHEARMAGADIQAPCVNHSRYKTAICGRRIYLGFVHIKALEYKTVDSLLRERERGGPFISLDDFMQRSDISLQQLKILVRVGALRFSTLSKKELMWQIHLRMSPHPVEERRNELFSLPTKAFVLPALHENALEDAFDQMELLGFPLCSPFELLAEPLPEHVPARYMDAHCGRSITMYGYMVTVKETKTTSGLRMNFGTWLDTEGHFFDTVHFPQTAQRYPLRGRGIYAIRGRVAEEFGFYSLEVHSLERLPYRDDPRWN